MSAADVHSILYKGPDPLRQRTEQPKYDSSKKVARYWPGKAPEWLPEELDEDYVVDAEEAQQAVVGDTSLQDRRLQRIVQAKTEDSPSAASRPSRHRAHRQDDQEDADSDADGDNSLKVESSAGVPSSLTEFTKVKIESTEQETANEDDARARRLAAARQRALQEEEELAKQQATLAAQEIEESDSSYEEESEDENPLSKAMLKPVFVPKSKRGTVKERELAEAEYWAQEEKKQQQLVERKKDSQQLLVDTYELWKIRELGRIKRDKEAREERQRYLAEIERRRNMTEEERRADDRRLDAMVPKKEKKHKFNFMQRYYHQGAFFQDKAQTGEEAIYLRDFQAPVGEDAGDKTALPKPMRLRRGQFGHAGQTKWTHLADADTTDFNAPWYQNDAGRPKSLKSKLGGNNKKREV